MPEFDPLILKIIADTKQLRGELQVAGRVTEAFTSGTIRQAGQIEAAARKSSSATARAFAQGAQNSRLLGAQIADIGTQIAGGASPFLILAQQGNQLAQALENPATRLGRFAALLTGPVGAAVLAAVSFLGLFITKMNEGADAADKKKDALEKLQDALRDYAEANGKAANSETVQIRLTELSTRALLDKAIAARQATRALLEQARAQFDIDRRRAQAPGQKGELASLTAANSAAQVGGLEAQINKQDKEIGRLQGASNLAAGASALLRVAAATDAVAKATQEYDLTLFSLNKKLKEGRIGVAEFERRSLAATKRRDAAIEAARDTPDRKRGPSAETLARRAEAERVREVRERAAVERELGAAQIEYLSVLSDLTADSRLQDEFLRDQIEIERKARARDYTLRGPGGTNEINQDELANLLAANDRIAAARQDLVNRKEHIRWQQEELALQQAGLTNERDILQAQGQLAETAAQRGRIAERLVGLAFEQERAELDAVIASKNASETQKQIAQKRLDILNQLEGFALEGARRANEGPLAQYRREISGTRDQINEDLERVSVRGLESLTDGITEAITGVRSLGDAFKSVANQIIGDLVRIGVQRAIIGPLADALFGPAAGGGGGGSGLVGGGRFSLLDSIFDGIFGRASGGFVGSGQLVRVNEAASPGRVEGFRPQGSGTIIPLGRMNAAVPSSAPIVNQTFVLDARYGITTPELISYVNRTAKAKAQEAGVAAYDRSMRDAPAAVSRARRFGTS